MEIYKPFADDPEYKRLSSKDNVKKIQILGSFIQHQNELKGYGVENPTPATPASPCTENNPHNNKFLSIDQNNKKIE